MVEDDHCGGRDGGAAIKTKRRMGLRHTLRLLSSYGVGHGLGLPRHDVLCLSLCASASEWPPPASLRIHSCAEHVSNSSVRSSSHRVAFSASARLQVLVQNVFRRRIVRWTAACSIIPIMSYLEGQITRGTSTQKSQRRERHFEEVYLRAFRRVLKYMDCR